MANSLEVLDLEVLELSNLTRQDREALLRELGYTPRGGLVYNSDGSAYLDRYTEDHVRVDNLAIVPGSVILLDNNPISLAAYVAEYED